MQQHRKRQDLLGNNICSIGEKKKKKPEAFAHSDGRTADGLLECYLPFAVHVHGGGGSGAGRAGEAVTGQSTKWFSP